MICSRSFRALMRRNLIYRKRIFIRSCFEILLPVAFVCILLAIKLALENSDSFKPEIVEPKFPGTEDTHIPFSFTDYVTAIQAKRECIVIGGDFEITGMSNQGLAWQVPFVKCDSRSCVQEGENATEKYCEYQVLAVAPNTADNDFAKTHVSNFTQFVYNEYPQLVTNTPFEYEFIKSFESDNAVQDYVKSGDYGKTGFPKVGLAVIFSSTGTKNYDYTIRVNSTNFNTPEEEGRPATRTTPNTDVTLNSFQKTDDDSCQTEGGTPDMGPLQNSCTGQYIYNGALTVQRLVGDWIMSNAGARDLGYFVAEHGVQYVSFPSKEYIKNGFYENIQDFAPLIVMVGFLYPVAAIIRAITLEKEMRQKELMKIMSVTEADVNWSWFCSYGWFHIITLIGVTVSSAYLYENSAAGYLFFFWLFTILSAVIIFGIFVASFMSRSTRATLIGLLLFFVGYFLTLIVSFDTGSSGIIALISLHPVAAFSFGLQEIGRLEDLGIGVVSSTVNETDSPSGYTLQSTYNALIIDCVIWGIVSWYLNRVVPSDFGQPLPWYFPFTGSYWCPGSASASIDDETDETEMISTTVFEPVSDALREQAAEGKSIEVRNLRKQFGEKTAVDGLSMSMYKGQITALLGHNGAGKTTTINMLTGMIAPTDGYAMVAGKDIRTQLNQIRGEIGICLQHDCLFPLLTVKEHIEFFARIKGLYAKKSRLEVEDSIRTSMEDVALLEKSNTLSDNLSGGMKRKLSVAIAFCGDSKTVLLDEPTSGMDPFSRRFTWNVIRQYRQDRCIILTTHFMDEADILGDRIAIMSEGQLRCLGSSLFLKKHYGVGYQLTIEKKSKSIGTSAHAEVMGIEEEEMTDPKLVIGEDEPLADTAESNEVETGVLVETVDHKLDRTVRGNVKGAKLLSNVGTEMSFQLPLNASSSFRPMFDDLDKEVDAGVIVTYGVGITTLDEVFLLVARGETGNRESMRSSLVGSDLLVGDGNKSVRSREELQRGDLFAKHVRALFQKRAVNFKRDKKAWCCSTFLPSIFVLIGFILFKFAGTDRNLDSLVLNLEDYNDKVNEEPRNPIPFNNPGEYTCQPGVCVYQDDQPRLSGITGENYTYCGSTILTLGNEKCGITESANVVSRITDAGAVPEGSEVTTVEESSRSLFNTANNYKASQYGALYFTHEIGSSTASNQSFGSYGDSVYNSCLQNLGDYVIPAQCENYRGIGYVVSYNFTSLHSSLLYQTLADEAIVQEALDDNEISIKTTIHPLPITKVENEFGQAEDAFSAWFLVVLSFPFIAGSFATFVVAEKLSKAKHLQTVAGVKPSAYWLSTYLWDILNYQFPLWITVILMFAFGVDSLTSSEYGIAGGSIITLILFGPAAAGFTYCISFAFSSPSMCNLFVIIFNFVVSMAGPLVSFILRLIGNDPANPNQTLVDVANAIEWVLRFIPSFCLGNSLFKIINLQTLQFLAKSNISVWHESGILYEIIFLAVECFAYILLAMQIDRWSTNPKAVSTWKSFVRFLTCRCCCGVGKELGEGITGALPDDEDVIAEAERVVNGGASNDLIVVDQLTKQYPNGKLAVKNLSFGIPGGECFGLLGINGAGKTTTMAMLTAEFPPTSGDAILAGYSVTREPEQTRRRIGYCPQFDAHFQNMTGREHVELYASIKGVPRENVKEAAAAKLREVGLNESDSDRLSADYSGGMKRKLSVACATIGQPEIVFLDEPSTGMDPVARRDLWQVISDMVCGTGPEDETSIILTTHSMEEAEALCPRIGIMANGKLSCLGSAQHLKSRFGQGYQAELKLREVKDEDEDYKEIVANLFSHVGVELPEESEDVEEAAGPNTEDVFFSLDEARAAMSVLTGDDYLSSLITSDDPTGYVIYKNASSPVGVPLDELASFAAEELRMRHLMVFFEDTYPNSMLRERQDNKARFEVASEGLRISAVFATFEENKERLMLSDYGISQTSLEQVFNMHAAEAEKLKQGADDR